MCREMQKHLRMEREAPRVSLHEQVQTMSALHTQLTTTSRFVREYEQELRKDGADMSTDPALQVM